MQLLPDIPLQARLFRWSRYLMVAVIAIASLAISGWLLDIKELRRPVPGLVAMNPLTAVSFIFSGISFFFITSARPSQNKLIIALVFASIVCLVGLTKVADLFAGLDWNIDQWLFPGMLHNDSIGNTPNSMAPNTAACFILVGAAFWLFHVKTNTAGEPVQYVVLSIALISWLSILGYVYQVKSFYSVLTYIPMAIHSAFCFLCVALAFLFAQPGTGIMRHLTSSLSGSLTARLLVPAAVVVPSVLGLIRLHGYWAGIYNTEFGVALYTLIIIVFFLALAWYNASVLNKRDMLRKQTDDALRNSEEEIAAIFKAAPDAVIVIDDQSRIIKWNPEAERLFGWAGSEAIGKRLTETIIPPEFRAAHQKGIQRFLRTGHSDIADTTIEIKALKKDDTVFDVALRIAPVVVKDSTMFVGFARDITERKKNDRKLKSFNEELSRQVEEKTREITEIFDRLTDGFISLDKNFYYTYANKKAGEITHRDPASLIGKNVWEEFPDAVGSDTYHAFYKALAEQQPLINIDHYAPLNLWQENHIYPSPNGLSVFVRDISKRKLAELALIEKEAKYRTLIEEAVDAVLVFSPAKDRYIEANKRASELLGYTIEELLQISLLDLRFPDDPVPTPYERLEAGESVRIERMLRRKDGQGVAVEASVKRLPDGNYLAFLRDITERKKAEQQIMEARKLSDKLIDSLPGVFYFYDVTGKFIRWNPQFEEVTGYTGAEIAEMHPTQFFPDDEKEYITRRIEDVFVKGMNDAEADFITKSGERRRYYFKAVLIRYEGQPCLLGHGVDVTERKKHEAELKASEEKYKLLFESNPLSMWMLSLPDYRVINVNTAALKQYGYSREEFLAMDIAAIRPKEDRDRFREITDTNFRSVHHAGIWRHQKKDGTILFVDVITHDIYYGGAPARFVLANDVTEKYIAEEKLRESYDSIRKLTEHLQKIREEERTHIAREIHDELGQQLTVLKMDISWLNKRIDPGDNGLKEKVGELLSMVDTTVKTVRRISSELRPSLIDDLGLIPAMEWHLEEFEKRSGIRASFTRPQTDQPLSDEIKISLFRIFQESLTNVARHAKAKEVNINLEHKDKKIILTIADDGSGFDEADGSKKTLGILGMKERTLMLGGEYSITGVRGKGTTVHVSVPLSGSDKKNQKQPV